MIQRKSMTIAGWVIAGLIAALMTLSAGFKLFPPPEVAEQVAQQGFPKGVMFYIGIVELICVVIYLIPRTAVLGAVLLTGYLGGAVETHVRGAESILIPAAVGVLVWLALYLRDARIRALLPLRMPAASSQTSNR